VRAWLLFRETMPFGRAVASIICDRIAALIVLIFIVAITTPLLSHAGVHVPLLEKLGLLAIALTVVGLSLLLLLGAPISDAFQRYRLLRPIGILVGNMRVVLFSSVNSILVLGLALLVQVIVVLAVVVCGAALGIDLLASHVLLLPLILLISMFPVSIAGWGVREGAMVVGLGLGGISASNALAMSLLFGLAQLVIGIPGGLMWLLWRGGRPRSRRNPESSMSLDRPEEEPGATRDARRPL
jgi:glycosyltransferase 2 family protein